VNPVIRFIIEAENRLSPTLQQVDRQLATTQAQTTELSTALEEIGGPAMLTALGACSVAVAAIGVAALLAANRLTQMGQQAKIAIEAAGRRGLTGQSVLDAARSDLGPQAAGLSDDMIVRLARVSAVSDEIVVHWQSIANSTTLFLVPAIETAVGVFERLLNVWDRLARSPMARIAGVLTGFANPLTMPFMIPGMIAGGAFSQPRRDPTMDPNTGVPLNQATPFGPEGLGLTSSNTSGPRLGMRGDADELRRIADAAHDALGKMVDVLRTVPVPALQLTEAGEKAQHRIDLVTTATRMLANAWEYSLNRITMINIHTNNIIVQLAVDLMNTIISVIERAIAELAAKRTAGWLLSFIPGVGPALAEAARGASMSPAGGATSVTINALDARTALLDLSSPSGNLRAAGYRLNELARVR